jgi:hypothetical protein
MSDSNGTTTATATAAKERKTYQPPEGDPAKVYDVIERSMNDIVWEASHQANQLVHQARDYDDDPKTLPARYGHLVDAAECLEIALTHLGILRSLLAYRMQLDGTGEQNTDIDMVGMF